MVCDLVCDKILSNAEDGSQKATLVALLLGITSLREINAQGFLNTQRSTTKLCIHILAEFPTDPPSMFSTYFLINEYIIS